MFNLMSSNSDDQPSLSAIIAGYLKFKVLRIKGGKDVGAHSPSNQGPKAWKQYWFEFRVVNNTSKIVEYYDKKAQDKTKGVILLDLVVSVQLLVPHKKLQFMMECSDGQARIFETPTIEEAYAWVTAFNAVLFGKNMRGETRLEYSVALQPSSLLSYYGPCILVINDSDIVIYKKSMSDDHVIVTWKLHHLRSFRAKKDCFIVKTGSRTTTGSGEFYFSTREDESILITYAIEAVLTRLKAKLMANSTTDSTSRRSMLPTPDDLGIMSPPMDTSQAPSHLDPDVGEDEPLTLSGPHSSAPTYVNDDVYLRPQETIVQGRGYDLLPSTVTASPFQRSVTMAGSSHFFSDANSDQPLPVPRSMSTRILPGHQRMCKYQRDEAIRGTAPQEHDHNPKEGPTSVYSVIGEEEEGEARKHPSLPPYDRLNRGLLNTLVSSLDTRQSVSMDDGYSRVQRESVDPHGTPMQRLEQPPKGEERNKEPSVSMLHKSYHSNPDLAASPIHDTKNTVLYDTVYECARSNSSGSITSAKNQPPSPKGNKPPNSENDSNEMYLLFGQFGSNPLKSIYCDIEANEKRTVVLEPSRRQVTKIGNTGGGVDNDVNSRYPKDMANHDGEDGDETRDRNVKPPPLPAAAPPEGSLHLYATVAEEQDDEYPSATSCQRSPLTSRPCLPPARPLVAQDVGDRDKLTSLSCKQNHLRLPGPSVDATYALLAEPDYLDTSQKSSTDIPKSDGPMVPPQKDGDKSVPKGKSNPPPLLNTTYEFLTDEPDPRSDTNRKSSTSRPSTEDRQVAAKLERTSTAQQKDRNIDKLSPPKEKSSHEVVNATYALLTDELDHRSNSNRKPSTSRPSTEDRQVAAKLERTATAQHMDKNRKPHSHEVVDATYALLTEEPDSKSDTNASTDKPMMAAPERLVPKPQDTHPIATKPKPAVPPKPQRLSTQPAARQKMAAKPPIAVRTTAKVPLNQYEGVPKYAPK